ncbi:MAG TPA: hypothetical protein VGM62_18350 [Chthoniobacterales bacterium]
MRAQHLLPRKACQVNGYPAEAMLSVAYGYHWITAARMAAKWQIPFYLIIHDEPLQLTVLPGFLRPSLRSAFSAAYRQARERFCVSPYMEAEYLANYGVRGTVLYPSRAAESPTWQTPPRRDCNSTGLKVAFAGTINSPGYAGLLGLLVNCLQDGDSLVLFGPHTAFSLKSWQVDSNKIRLGGLIPPDQIIERLRSEFDVLFVPMSFDPTEADNMRKGFPSKIADYSATGVPMLICGPEYCSAVHWARTFSPVAEVVTSPDSAALASALQRLSSASHRSLLAERALAIGEQLFSHTAAQEILYGSLRGNRVKPPNVLEASTLSIQPET